MSPLEEYNLIILNRQQNPLDCSEYGETHHIIPRSCGGCNEEWNLVRLTPEEHYRCHELLPFIYTKGKAHRAMVHAWWLLSHTTEGVEIPEEDYGILERMHSTALSMERTGEGNPMYGKPSPMKGKHHSEEARARMSKTRRGKPSPKKGKPGHPCSEEARRKISEANKGHPGYFTGHHSEESKRKMSEARKRYWANKRTLNFREI